MLVELRRQGSAYGPPSTPRPRGLKLCLFQRRQLRMMFQRPQLRMRGRDQQPLIGQCTREARAAQQRVCGGAELDMPKPKRLSPPPVTTPAMITTRTIWSPQQQRFHPCHALRIRSLEWEACSPANGRPTPMSRKNQSNRGPLISFDAKAEHIACRIKPCQKISSPEISVASQN